MSFKNILSNGPNDFDSDEELDSDRSWISLKSLKEASEIKFLYKS